MAKQRMKFTFPSDLVTEPVVYTMGKEFAVVTNIRRANVSGDRGWVILEITGAEGEVERAIQWAIEKGVRVDPIEGDVIAG